MKLSPAAKPSSDFEWALISARLVTYVVMAWLLAEPLRSFGKGLEALASMLGRFSQAVCW